MKGIGSLPKVARSNSLLEDTFDYLINTFVENKVGIAQHFLSDILAFHLKNNLQVLYQNDQMRSAGTGNEETLSLDKKVRGDKIHWLDKKNNNEHELSFFKLMDSFILHLNESCYTGITGYEFHYTMYEPGSFYKKHLDQFRNSDSRQYSMILYLNNNWEEIDGGELCIYHADDSVQHISPENGKIVFFKSSELEHAVLLTNKRRMSITGWLKRDIG